MTLPNIILTWCTYSLFSIVRLYLPSLYTDLSPASAAYRRTLEEEEEAPPINANPAPSLSTPKELEEPECDLEITPELSSAFAATLKAYNITLRFFAGAWESFLQSGSSVLHNQSLPRPYDVVLTSETIYRTDSLDSLIRLLYSGTAPSTTRPSLDTNAEEEDAPLCLVAAKIVYFGVGGGVNEFIREVQGMKGKNGRIETVWENKEGVGRIIMRLRWS